MDIKGRNEDIVDMADLDEENFAVCSSSQADKAFDEVIGCIEDVVIGDEFQHLKEIFMEKHFQEFDNSEENRLCYTSIFNEYVNLLEKHLEGQLTRRIPGFSMNDFIQLLVQHKDEVPEDIFDMLQTFTDFMAFKEMFLEYRADKEGRGFDPSLELVVTSLVPEASNTQSQSQ